MSSIESQTDELADNAESAVQHVADRDLRPVESQTDVELADDLEDAVQHVADRDSRQVVTRYRYYHITGYTDSAVRQHAAISFPSLPATLRHEHPELCEYMWTLVDYDRGNVS